MPHNYNSMFWKNLGDGYVKAAKYNRAIYCYKVAVRYNPENRSAYNNLGYVYQKTGKAQEAREIKKKLEETPEETDHVAVSQKESKFDDPFLLFFIFFIVMWGLFFLYWYVLSAGYELTIGTALAGISAFLVTGWVWAFFFLWDSETTLTRILALLITAVIGGVILLFFRTGYERIRNIS
jgi:tetratricopeptide (TPR) repeat protein